MLRNIVRAAAMFAVLLVLPGCATAYLDASVPEMSPADKVSVANPQPVQVLYEFQTKGVANGQGTGLTQKAVTDAVQASGLFSTVSADPVANGALLHIVINNVPLEDDAFAKGFVTGFTFGLVGNTVGDGYVCSVEYQANPKAPQVDEKIRDAIYTSIGATSGPQEKAEKMPDLQTAAQTMARRVVAHMLNDLGKNPNFAGPMAATPVSAPASSAGASNS